MNLIPNPEQVMADRALVDAALKRLEEYFEIILDQQLNKK